MRLVKQTIAAIGLLLLAACLIGRDNGPEAGPAPPSPRVAQTLARADLAEAVFAMVLENAAAEGKPLSQPLTLCQACVAAHLGLAAETVRSRCERACGLR
jgi:hypothetical protein